MNNKELEKLNKSFGNYKAEWLNEKIFDFFTEPSYYIGLKDNRPCVLKGGRGTGKTTVLKGLSYQGQYAIQKNSIIKFDKNNFIGIYHKINTNHVRAFIGGGIDEEGWKKLFGHYFNLIICREILFFIKWHMENADNDENLSSEACALIANSMNLEEPCDSFNLLLETVEKTMYSFQSQINNISNKKVWPQLSLQGDPIKLITKHVIDLEQFKNKTVYLLIDEYENLSDYQQQCINTLIKHSDKYFTFKIGVRELGWKIKHTLNTEEALTDPADYFMIDIEQEFAKTNGAYFEKFARSVCQQRIKELFTHDENGEYLIENALTSMSMEEEAQKLGVEKALPFDKYPNLALDDKHYLQKLSSLYQYFLFYWAENYSKELTDIISDHKNNKASWDTRFENYKYSMLFKIKKGRGMGGIQKYYSGWNTFLVLANGNIRYLMQLVYRSYEKHLKEGHNISIPVSPENQTRAASETGQKNLVELEGLCKNGTQLTKLLFGFGRIFNLMITGNTRKAPEINQFVIKDTQNTYKELLRDAVMYLACIRIPGNKPSSKSTTKDYMYALHPIYAPFFVFSHRKKRKMEVTEDELKDIIFHTKKYIEKRFKKKKKIAERKKTENNRESLFLFQELDKND